MSWAALLPQPEVREITGQEAEDLLISEFGELTLVPIDIDATREKLIRAGFVQPGPSPRSTLRAEFMR